VFVAYDQAWMDQSSSWWAKANRAKEHIHSLQWLTCPRQRAYARAPGPVSGRLYEAAVRGSGVPLGAVMERQGVAHGHQKSFRAQQAGGDLCPGFGAGAVDEPVALAFEFSRGGGDI
jgi:hypothetical protein